MSRNLHNAALNLYCMFFLFLWNMLSLISLPRVLYSLYSNWCCWWCLCWHLVVCAVFLSCEAASVCNACRARYCFTILTTCLSVHCWYCVKTNGHIVSLDNLVEGSFKFFRAPMLLQNSKGNPSPGHKMYRVGNYANIALITRKQR